MHGLQIALSSKFTRNANSQTPMAMLHKCVIPNLRITPDKQKM